jgi:hypothetical protein
MALFVFFVFFFFFLFLSFLSFFSIKFFDQNWIKIETIELLAIKHEIFGVKIRPESYVSSTPCKTSRPES